MGQQEVLEKKYLTKSIESCLQLKSRLYGFQLKREISIDEHMNNYTKLLTDLVNVDVKIEEEYETFILTLINGKQTLNYSDVSAALVNYKVGRKNKLSSSNCTSTEALMVRGRCSN